MIYLWYYFIIRRCDYMKEPLLKEVYEPIVFRETKKSKNKKAGWRACLDKSVILTLILTIGIFYYFGKITYAFYIGFKYYDLRYMENVAVLSDNTLDENNE